MRTRVIGIITIIIKTLVSADDPFDEIWSDSQCKNIGRGIKDLEVCKAACRGKTGCTAVNFCTKGNDCVLRACKDPIPAPTWKYRDDCKGHTVGPDDPGDKIWSDSQCRNIGRGIKDLEECKAACRMKIDCTAVNFCTKGNDCVFRACKEPIPAPAWKYRDDCKGHIAGSVPVGAREEYLALKIDGSDEYFKQVKKLLPQLLWADLLDEGEVGVALARQSVYPALDFRREEGVFDLHPKNQVVTINGTVTKKIGKRSYTAAKFRQTGLYAAPGDIVTITIPPQLIGKISAHIGQDDKAAIKFETLNKAVNKIASPYGGLILVYLSDIDATTKEGMFEVKIDNAVQAPFFTLGINTNEEWNQMKMYSPPFTVMRIPGQIRIYMQTKHLQTITDMVARLKDWKVTIDILDDLVGVPLNIQPGEERFHYDPTRGGGVRWDVCAGGGKSEADAAYWPKFVDYKNKHPTVVFHELGHGYCYSDLPDMGAQWTAELVREYIERKRNYEVGAKNFEFPFTILHQMVSFSKLSKGKACGVAKFPAGDDQSKTSFPYNDYFTCWTFLYRLPLWEFGWDVLRLVFTLDTESTTSYSSKTDRMADLYCQATKSNLVPLFEFYNIKISKSVADTCRKQKPSVMITNYIKIANCIMNKDIMECASLPEFPPYTGICRLSGVCNKHPDHDNKQITLNEEFDLWGGTTEPEFKKGLIDTTRNERNCHGRAEETFKWCRNEIDQSITASFTLKNGDSSSQTFPLSDDSFDEIWSDSQCRNIGRGIKNLEECKSACRGKNGCTAVNFCTKGNDCVFRACKEPIPAPTWKYRDDCKGHIVGPGQ